MRAELVRMRDGLRRALARTSDASTVSAPPTVLDLGRKVHPSYTWARHHELIARRLHALLDGTLSLPSGRRCRRLLVTTPPQHSKSSLTSQLFPACVLSRDPSFKLLLLSYSATLAESHSLSARDAAGMCGTSFRLDPRAQSRNDWRTTEGGYLISAGIGGSVTGRAADGIIIDDPVRNAQDALSPAVREKVWRGYSSVVETRLAPDGFVALIQTRWGDEDLAGKLLETEPDDWFVVRLPALCEEPEHDPLGRTLGEPLWPDRYPLEWYLNKRKTLEDRGLVHQWHALYQCDPRGDGTPREFSQYLPVPLYDEEPRGHITVLACDPSKSKSDKAGDYAAFTLTSATADKAPHLYVKSWALRTSANEVSATAIALIEQYRPTAFVIETTMFQSLFLDRIQEVVTAKGLPCRMFSYTAPQHFDKKTKIRVMLGHLLQQKRLHLHARSPATKLFQQMLSDFPNDKAHDDLPDSLCMGIFVLGAMGVTNIQR